MKTLGWALMGAGILLMTSPGVGEAQLRAGVMLDRDGARSLHIAIGEIYRAPVRELRRYGPSRIHPDELPVVYFLAREARVGPETVIALRERGWSWMEVTHHLRLSPTIFVRHLPRTGPPYGKAHGYWARHHRHAHRLGDREIIDYVNLALWSEYQRQPVYRVIQAREQRGSWAGVSRGAIHGPPPVQMKEHPGRGRGGPPSRAGGIRGATARPGRSGPVDP